MLDDDQSWVADAACVAAGVNLDDFFPPPGRGLPIPLQELCAACPVRLDCLEHALRCGFEAGWFGGLSPEQRRQLPPPDVAALLS